MSFLWGKSKPKTNNTASAIQKLRAALETAQKKITHWEVQKSAVEKEARESGVRTKVAKAKTKQLLIRRQMLCGFIENMVHQQNNLEMQIFALESTAVTAETVSAMEHGIKTQRGILDHTRAADVVDNLHDSMADMADLQGIMSASVAPRLDEADFDELWAEFEAADTTTAVPAPAPEAPAPNPAVDIPDAPSTSLVSPESDSFSLMASLGL